MTKMQLTVSNYSNCCFIWAS